ncbi:MAG: hypothetical protein M2R45_01827 [Verrucomicrobia subdivision 3 bacterium]|nr:hypothetical protein [Limisphaerales bacterium]MCS1415818.1 hypothetical protein [Limisphaerales bacterium]
MRFKNLSIYGMALLVVALWQFPGVWYAGVDETTDFVWFREQFDIEGWTFDERPVSDGAEEQLAADLISNGEFVSDEGHLVRVFSAKRFYEKKNAIGLLTHTPDNCWSIAGMRVVPVKPYVITKEVDGIEMMLERRVFSAGNARELVYFGATVGGKPLPYRMDVHLNAALGNTVTEHRSGPLSRLVNPRVWGWAFESFQNRTRLAGPQQFIRISTPVTDDIKEAERRLNFFLEKWLVSTPYIPDDAMSMSDARTE